MGVRFAAGGSLKLPFPVQSVKGSDQDFAGFEGKALAFPGAGLGGRWRLEVRVAKQRVFITGATGFVGGHVARLLIDAGFEVCALRRSAGKPPLLARDELEWRWGDLRNAAAVEEAMRGCSLVYHVAADYRLWCRKPRELYANNVIGTRNVLRAARKLGIARMVYTSTVGVLGRRRDGRPADETTPGRYRSLVGHYKRSKYLAEREVLQFVEEGLPVVLVHPSTPVGPADHKPTPTGQIIVDYLNRRMPAYLDTGLNLVDVRDVARGHLLAMERGTVGGRYILGHRNMTLAEIFACLEAITGIPAPRYRLPYRPLVMLAALNQLFSKVSGIPPRIPWEGVRMARYKMFFDASRAVEELGLPQTPIQRALIDGVRWFMDQGYVK